MFPSKSLSSFQTTPHHGTGPNPEPLCAPSFSLFLLLSNPFFSFSAVLFSDVFLFFSFIIFCFSLFFCSCHTHKHIRTHGPYSIVWLQWLFFSLLASFSLALGVHLSIQHRCLAVTNQLTQPQDFAKCWYWFSVQPVSLSVIKQWVLSEHHLRKPLESRGI